MKDDIKTIKMQANTINNKIVHLVTRDKFTEDYINFMITKMCEYEHVFFTRSVDDEKDVFFLNNIVNSKCIFFYDSFRSFAKKKDYINMIIQAKCIIVSGLFDQQMLLSYFGRKVLKKTYIQFWGGDYYYFSDHHYSFDYNMIQKLLAIHVCRNMAGAIFLIDEEKEVFEKITTIYPQKCFTAQMPLKYDFIFQNNSNRFPKKLGRRILIGNSATKANNHFEIIAILKGKIRENDELICPLSYGDMDYAQEVIKEGKKAFGNNFVPLVNFMPKDEYYGFLNSCDIGIFANDRQQALGNIYYMIAIGKKVFLRDNTSMKKYFDRIGVKTYGLKEIEFGGIDIEQNLNSTVSNGKIIRNIITYNYARKQWKEVFDTIL